MKLPRRLPCVRWRCRPSLRCLPVSALGFHPYRRKLKNSHRPCYPKMTGRPRAACAQNRSTAFDAPSSNRSLIEKKSLKFYFHMHFQRTEKYDRLKNTSWYFETTKIKVFGLRFWAPYSKATEKWRNKNWRKNCRLKKRNDWRNWNFEIENHREFHGEKNINRCSTDFMVGKRSKYTSLKELERFWGCSPLHPSILKEKLHFKWMIYL